MAPKTKLISGKAKAEADETFINCYKALNNWEAQHGEGLAETSEIVELADLEPPIGNMDTSLNKCASVKHLSLDGNRIERMIALPALLQIEVLSLERNRIKRICGLAEIGVTLKELRLSHNLIASLNGVSPARKLKALAMASNCIADWAELKKLEDNPTLCAVTFQGNPLYEKLSPSSFSRMLQVLPAISYLDGEAITVQTVRASLSSASNVRITCSSMSGEIRASIDVPANHKMIDIQMPLLEAGGLTHLVLEDGRLLLEVLASNPDMRAAELLVELPSAVGEECLTLFKQFDEHGDGAISSTVFEEVLLRCGMPPGSIGALFEAADANKDGSIDYTEFLAWVFAA